MFQYRKQITVSVPADEPTTGGTEQVLSNLPQAHTEHLCAQATCWTWGPRLTSGSFQEVYCPSSISSFGVKRFPSMLHGPQALGEGMEFSHDY